MVIVCYLLLLLTDYIVIRDLRLMSLYDKFLPKRKKSPNRGVIHIGRWDISINWATFYTVFAILVIAVLTVAVCMPAREASRDITAKMWLLYIVLTVVISQLFYSIFSLLGYIPSLFSGRRWNTGLWIGLPVGVITFLLMWWGALIGRRQINVEKIEIASAKLPESFDGYRIVQISDLHLGTWGEDTTFVSEFVDKVNALDPDLIVFTGDAVNRTAYEFKPFVKPLSRLHARDGVYSVLGNHDYGDYVNWNTEEEKVENLDRLKEYQKLSGWRLLDNSHVFIRNEQGDSIALIGVGNWGEPPFSQYGNLTDAYPKDSLNDSNFKILLSHNPEHWNREVTKISNIDLTLAGHTHAMQISMSLGGWKWSPSKYKYEQWGGLYSRENESGDKGNIYVNIGAGEVGLPMRIGATPEITLITLRSKIEKESNREVQ